jgi:hypothetical protein
LIRDLEEGVSKIAEDYNVQVKKSIFNEEKR